jgi:hypothetical protein
VSPIPTKRTDRFSETTIDGEVVIMSLENGDFFSLTGTARSIWELIDGVRSRDALLAELAATYEMPGVALAADVDAFLAQLAGAGLLDAG